MSKRNENRMGYKMTKVGWIPEEWECVAFKSFAKLTAGGTPSTRHPEYWNGSISWMCSGELNLKQVLSVKGRISEKGLKNSSTKIIPKHSVLVGLAGQGKTRGTVAINEIDLCTNQSVAAILPDTTKAYYLYLFFNLDNRYEELRRLSTGDGGRGGLNLGILGTLKIPLPTLSEQNEIAEILSEWDKAIEHLEKLITAKSKLKKAFMQQLLTGKHRFKEFKSNKWEKMKLHDLLKPVSRPVSRPDKKYLALGLRSHGKGTFLRTVDNPEEVMMDTLYEVKENDLIVNITFAWEGAIAIVNTSDEGALVSHRFPTYVFKKNKATPEFFRHIILTKQFVHKLGLISPGGAGRNRVMSKRDFLNLVVSIPQLPEQKKIGVLLNGLDKEINLLRNRLKAFNEQKKGLMQKLLTGNVRVRNRG